jgi:peptide/nickel transport system permease protein
LSLSLATGVPVRELLFARIPQTAFIGVYAIVIAVGVSLVAGTISAVRHGRLADTISTSLAAIGISMPDFWIAYVLIYTLALGTGWFPAYGYVAPAVSITGALHSGFLPALAIAAPMSAVFTRILRTSLLENLYKDHALVARSLGHRPRFIFVHHVLRNALIPYITVIGLQVRYLLGGTVVIERIFGIPGVGNLMVDGALGRDFPVVQACTVVFLLGVLLTNFVVDFVCGALNPRTRA